MDPTPFYDHIAERYKNSKTLPFRTCVEVPTLFRLLGNVEGLRVLDLACGEGIYTRQVKRLGADSILGVDLSPAMIALAEAEEARQPLGCSYRVHDVAGMGRVDTFDIVLGVYLLNYARTYEQLEAFCRTIYANLRPGGRFIGINDNMHHSPEPEATDPKYGFLRTMPEGRREGATITYRMFNPDGSSFTFENYYLSPETYARAFETVGFSTFEWRGPWLSEDETCTSEPGYWEDFMARPPIIGIEATR